MEMQLPAFVVSMDAQRLGRTREALRAHGIQLTHVPGVDGSDPALRARGDVSRFAKLFCPDKTLGCALAHRAAARALLATGAPAGLVLEDDVVVCCDGDLRRELEACAVRRDDAWDVIRLYCQGFCSTNESRGITMQGSTAAYLLSRQGARRLSELPVWWHVDVELNRPTFRAYVGPTLFGTLDDRSGPTVLGQSVGFWLRQPAVREPLSGATVSFGEAALAFALTGVAAARAGDLIPRATAVRSGLAIAILALVFVRLVK